jgi:hypothetical protein
MNKIEKINTWPIENEQIQDGYDWKTIASLTIKNFNILLESHNELIEKYNDLYEKLKNLNDCAVTMPTIYGRRR